MTSAQCLFQEIDKIREKHPDVREVLIDISYSKAFDRIVTKYYNISYCSWITYYDGQYWDDEEELHDHIYEGTTLDDAEIDDIIANLKVFDAIIIYGV